MDGNVNRSTRALTVSVLAVTAVVVLSVLWHWVVLKRHEAQRVLCLNNLKCIGTSLNIYRSDWDDCFPPLHTLSQRAPKGKAWPDLIDLGHGRPRIGFCPGGSGDRLSFSYNSRLASRSCMVVDKTHAMISIFESVSDSPRNNNLHGNMIWHPKTGHTPPVGSLVVWTEDTVAMGRSLPMWARPRHNTVVNVCFADGHVSPEGWTLKYTLSPKSPE